MALVNAATFCHHIFSPLEEGEWSSFWLIVELDKKLFTVSYSPLMIPINKLPLSDKNMKKKAKAREDRDREKWRALNGVDLCFPGHRRLLQKYKKLASELPNWSRVAKGTKSGRSFEGHLTALHSQLTRWLQNLQSTDESSRPPQHAELFIPVSPYIKHSFLVGKITVCWVNGWILSLTLPACTPHFVWHGAHNNFQQEICLLSFC